MKKQKVVNTVLMSTDAELLNNYTRDQLQEMYTTITEDDAEMTDCQLVNMLRFTVNSTCLHNGISHNLYAIHTCYTDTFRAVYTLNTIYGEMLKYPAGYVEKAYEELCPKGKATCEDDMILEMVDYLREHDATAIYD